MKANTRTADKPSTSTAGGGHHTDIERAASTNTEAPNTEECFGPLSNVRFAVFALGSSAYPNFCAYGKYVDSVLGELGGERLTPLTCGDEMLGQEHAFRQWAPEVFRVACETFCLDSEDTLTDASKAMQNDALTVDTVRLVPSAERQRLDEQLDRYYNKRSTVGKLKRASTNLHASNAIEAPAGGDETAAADRSVILVEIQANEVSRRGGVVSWVRTVDGFLCDR